MLSAPQVSQLVTPVACRAQASDQADRSGFADRAAHYVLKQLGRSSGTEPWPAYNASHVGRWSWIDKQAVEFFLNHPLGRGVEVDGGLSTRFHRISEQLDWPRFSWNAINTADITECLQYIFPPLDNYSSVSSGNPRLDWPQRIDWRDATPKIVIIGEQAPASDWGEISHMIDTVQSSLASDCPQIDILVSHTVYDLELFLTDARGVSIKRSFSPEQTPKGFIDRLLQKVFYGTPEPNVHVSHLVITRH